MIGRNGTCKSTLLRSIALGCAGEKDAHSLLDAPIGSLVRHGNVQGLVSVGTDSGVSSMLWLRDGDERGTQMQIQSQVLLEPRPFVCGFGASRFFTGPESGSSTYSYALSEACATLFNRPTPMGDPELTLRRLKEWFQDYPAAFQRVWRGIREVIGLTADDDIDIGRGGGLTVQGPTVGSKLDFRALADGYRVTFNWIIDFYAQALRANAIDDEGHIHGVLLVDEIEQHLHPAMQLEILPKLTALFPHVQIIATTHSPQVALSVAPENLVSLKRDPVTGLVTRVPVIDFSRFSAEDVLADPTLFESPTESSELRKARLDYRLLQRKLPGERTTDEQLQLAAAARRLAPDRDELPLAVADPELAALLERASQRRP